MDAPISSAGHRPRSTKNMTLLLLGRTEGDKAALPCSAFPGWGQGASRTCPVDNPVDYSMGTEILSHPPAPARPLGCPGRRELSSAAPESKLIQLLPSLPPTHHMQMSPNVRSNRRGEEERGEGREISQALHHLEPGSASAPTPPAPGKWLRQSLHPRGWRHVWDPLLQSRPRKQEPGVCTALAASGSLGSSSWFGSWPHQGRAEPRSLCRSTPRPSRA